MPGGMTLALAHTDSRPTSPLERLELLCDPGSLQLMRTRVESRHLGSRAQPGDGVVAGLGTIDGRPVVAYAQDPGFVGGSLGEAHAETIVRALTMAGRMRVPVIAFVESGGARMQEGVGALAGYGRIFRETVRLSRHVPQISIVCGTSAGGGAYSPALTDFVIMTKQAAMFLTGPRVVEAALGERVTAQVLGGARVHQRNGVCHLVADDEAAAAAMARELVGYLTVFGPEPSADAGRERDDPAAHVPAEPRRGYDVRRVIDAVVDDGMLEISGRWARNLVTGFARLGGRPVGVIANQPHHLGGVLDAESSEKGAWFVNTCDRLGVPLVVLVDTPGFMPGTHQETAGVIRHGAALVRAFAGATVPRVTVVLRKAYGGAYITMNSRELGADLVLAWPDAEVGVMAARPAVAIVNRRELAEAADAEAAHRALADAYAERHLSAAVAARDGFVDELVPPVETRERLARALDLLTTGATTDHREDYRR
jgi:acetyl-CoA carboxylase carboxyltransferase component